MERHADPKEQRGWNSVQKRKKGVIPNGNGGGATDRFNLQPAGTPGDTKAQKTKKKKSPRNRGGGKGKAMLDALSVWPKKKAHYNPRHGLGREEKLQKEEGGSSSVREFCPHRNLYPKSLGDTSELKKVTWKGKRTR